MRPCAAVRAAVKIISRREIAALLSTATLLFASGTVRAAEEAPPEPAAAKPAGPVDEFDRGTPRSAAHGYLVASREGDYERAANFLQLGSVPKSQRARKGPALARQLKTVLDRELWVELDRLSRAGARIHELGMRFNAGHALTYYNVQPVAALPGVRELHIGHSIVSRAVLVGIREAVAQMKTLMREAAE